MAKTQTFLQKCCPQRRCRKIAQCDWTLKVNNPRMDLFNNKISTSIYNPINFVPKSLALQFSRTVNIFFLCVGGLQIIGPISTTDGIPVIFLPLTMIIIFASIKEIIEDLKRHKSDKIENNKKVMIYKEGSFVEDKWENIHVGHIIKVREDEPIPADILLLNTSLKKGVCYIETKNLDGETNLKTKCVHKDIPAWESVEELVNNSDINLKYERPNEYLYKFCGCLKTLDQDIAVNEQNFLLRGSFLRNTPEVIGVVCYTGHLTKIMLNSTNSKSKLSKLERDMGRLIGFLFMILFSFTLFAATYASIWAVSEHDETQWYLDPHDKNPHNHNYAYLFPIQIGSWLLLLCGCVPISLLVMVEICRLVQSLLISIDPGMKQIETNVTTSVQSPSLTEELGQIEYILSDKTGTLTKNIMDFKKISIGGELYGNISTQKEMVTYAKVPNVDFWDTHLMEDLSNPNMNNHKAVKECVTLLAVCHTAVVQEKKGEKFYNTTSPDELALVNFAKFVGIEFEGIDEENNMCIIYKKKVLKYKLLQVFEFNSDRKRMSVIVKTPEGKIMLYTKGADTVLLDRMDEEDHDNGYHVMIANAHVQKFATEGLRTLLLAKRELSMPEYLKWAERYEIAKTTIVDREEEMEKLQSAIEVDLKLVGATGIEDKLQDEVGITIAKFKEAGMKVWMLTGDKVETAISIGYACQLLDTTMTHFVLTEKTHEEVAESIANKLLEVEASDNELTRFSLVISGEALIHAMRPEICQNLIKIAKRCQAVIACRVSPKQKQQFVSLIKKNSPKSSTLAIGDGANDVYMITAASVGVGIRGLEGQQAARASDFAIGEFKLLRRLLFYHGRENYRRNSYLVLYNFYKNIAVVSSYLWFGFFNGFSATPFIDKFLYQCFNTVFTSVPIILFATLDGEFAASKLVNTPALYVQGIKNELFNRKKFAKWVFIGIFESAIVGCYGIFTFDKNFSDDDGGRFIGLYGCGMFLYTGIVYIVNLKIIAMCNSFNFLVLFFVALSVIVFNMCFLAGTQIKGITVYGFLNSMAANTNFYIGICVVAVATYTPALVHRSFYYLDQLCPPAPIIKIEANKEFKRIFPAEKEILNLVDLTKDEETPHAHAHPIKFPLKLLRGNSDTTSMFSETQSP